jgi:dienelactone hydrolase
MLDHPAAFTRRQLVTRSSAHALGLAVAQALWRLPALAQEAPTPQPLNRFSRLMQDYFVMQVREAAARRSRLIDALKTKDDAQKYVASVRSKIQQCFGPFPEKTPLNARVTGTVERDAYKIEKVIFESRPGFLVTANLYVPQGRKLPLPGVVGTCGHSANGKAAEAYQSFAQGLAGQGYVVLIYDPIGQGERLQYPGDDLKSQVGAGVREHLLAGNQQYLVGEFFGSWRAWDGIRALDYLLTRDEVDPQQVGVTGNSGGGTMTTWLCGVEQRWSMAAPSCFVTTFRRNLENELPQDTEQCPPRAIALGLDHGDFIAALAPKPVILLTKERDYFDVRGGEETFAQLKRLYALLDAEGNIALFTGPTEHGYSQENREAMYRFFNGVTRVSDADSEPPLTIEEDATLSCTPRGQVSELGSRTVMSFTREASVHLRETRPALSGAVLVHALRDLLKLPERKNPPEYRILRPIGGRKYPRPHATTYAVETEPGVFALVYRLQDRAHYSRPPRDAARAVLYVSHHSADAELRDEPLLRELIEAEPQSAFYACDVRGIGESRPDTCGADTFLQPYGADYFYAAHALMFDRPYPAQRVHDALSVIDWLVSHGHTEVHLAARGWGAIPATFAAVLSDAVVQVTLKHALTSYADVAEAEQYDWPLSALLPGVLRTLDLPNCYAILEAKNLRQLDPLGASART